MYIYYKYHKQVREFLKAQRKIKKSHVAMRGLFYSPKNGKMIQYESSLERDLLTLMEFDHSVKSFLEQPVKIEYIHKNKASHYTPDLLVEYREEEKKPLLIEVKYIAYIEHNKEILAPKIKAATDYCTTMGYEFRIMTEKDIRTPMLDNAKILKPFRRSPVYEPLINPIYRFIRDNGPSNPLQIMKGCAVTEIKQQNVLHTVWGMVSLGLLRTDLSKPLSMQSILSI